ncbi:MAG: competence/damage-inducible protein A [Phycisphaerae bacterium]|nr:competence/damage-inducible protein A [Phycisphaerae bacterium]
MKKASLISIGNEVLSGQTVDTNSAYLGSKLLDLNVPVVSGYTVGDDVGMIVTAINHAAEDSDIILITGGLGPTDDDLTRGALSDYLGVELEFREELFETIKIFFARRGLKMVEKNISQAYLPAGSNPMVNGLGTAPGVFARKDDKMFFVMPGVPSEMKVMFEKSVLPLILAEVNRQSVFVKKLKLFGAGESTIAEKLGDLMRRDRNPLINCTVSFGEITLHVIGTSEEEKTAEAMVFADVKVLRNMFGDLVFGEGDQSLSEVVANKLLAVGKTVSTAESCTGGLIAKLLTDVPGASGYFGQGWVTYSNESKINQLNVSADTIERYGAVSEQVAEEMAINARKISGSDFSIAATGIAGPSGGSEQKPVGLVYLCIDSPKGCCSHRYVFSHDRSFVRFRAAQTALNLLRLAI